MDGVLLDVLPSPAHSHPPPCSGLPGPLLSVPPAQSRCSPIFYGLKEFPKALIVFLEGAKLGMS